jgi:S1-C subfamily serine protease
MEVPLGAGSGFVWDDRGHIVTNYHVVRNAQSAQVAILTKVGDDKSRLVESSSVMTTAMTSMRPSVEMTDYKRSVYKARVVGADPGKDICVLKVDAPPIDLFPIEVGTSTGLRVGQGAMAIGNPFGLDHTLTVGVISGIGREVRSPTGRPISNVIQTDAVRYKTVPCSTELQHMIFILSSRRRSILATLADHSWTLLVV